MNRYMIFLFCIVVLPIPVYSLEFRDTFSINTLNDPGRYVRHLDPEFSVQKGRLFVHHKQNSREILGILPVFGKNARFSCEVQWLDGDECAFYIYYDWRYKNNGRVSNFLISLSNNRIYYTDREKGFTYKTVPFEKNKRYKFTIVRKGEQFAIYVDGEKQVDLTIKALHDKTTDHSSDINYGGFAFSTYKDMVPFTMQIDNVLIKGDASPVQIKSIYKTFSLKNLEYRLTMVYQEGYKAWAEKHLLLSIPYLKYLYSLYGVPPKPRFMGYTQAEGPYYQTGAGYNNGGMVTGYGKKTADETGLNNHELAHFWAYLYGKRWNVEGSADFAGTAYHLYQNSGFYNLLDSKDKDFESFLAKYQPLYLDELEGNEVYQCRWKNAAVIYYLYRVLGKEGFKDLHRQAHKLAIRMDSHQIKEMAEAIAGRKLDRIFDGWVFNRAGATGIADSYNDKDNDGLADLDEWIYRTDPAKSDSDGDGYSDLAEIKTGFDPLSGDDPGYRVILADGSGSDWQGRSVTGTDREDKNRPDDLQAVTIVFDRTNNLVLLRLDYYRLITQPGNVTVTVDFRFGAKKEDYYRVNMNHASSKSNFYLLKGGEVSGKNGSSIMFKTGVENNTTFFEASIPVDLLELWNIKDDIYFYSTSTDNYSDVMDDNPYQIEKAEKLPLLPESPWDLSP